MNILLTYHELGFRGGERLFSTLSEGLIRGGNKVILVAGRENSETVDFPKSVKIIKPSQFFNTIFKNNWIFATISFPLTFLNILKAAKKCDIIYAGESFVTLWPTIVVAKLLNKKIVLSVFELGKAYKGPFVSSGIINALWNVINTFLIKEVKYAVTINTGLIPLLKRNYGIKHIYSIPAGIDFTIFYNPKPNEVIKKYNLESKKIILIQGTLHPQKKQELAIKALKIVRKQIKNAVLIIAGSGDPEYLTKLKTLAYKLNLNDFVIFADFIPQEYLKNYYSASDACLMCGPIGGLTIIEAAYFGKITVYPTSGKPPLGPVEEYGLGIVVLHRNESEFAQKLTDILKNPNKYNTKSLSEQKFVKKKFSQKHFVESTFKLFQDLEEEK